jgi:hypothetical protein
VEYSPEMKKKKGGKKLIIHCNAQREKRKKQKEKPKLTGCNSCPVGFPSENEKGREIFGREILGKMLRPFFFLEYSSIRASADKPEKEIK